MRIDPHELGNKRKEIKKLILEALGKINVRPNEPFDAIERSATGKLAQYDICIGKERFAVEIERRR